MTLLQLIILICVIGLAFWANNKYLAAPVKVIVNIILIIICVLIVLSFAGMIGNLNMKV